MLTNNALLQSLYQRGTLRAIDRQFAQFIAQQMGDEDSPVVGWAALVSFELGKGNVCVDLSALDPSKLFDLPAAESAKAAALLEPENAVLLLKGTPVVGDGTSPTPLVLEGARLYLHRYWQSERRVADEIKKRAVSIDLSGNTKTFLDELFAPDMSDLTARYADWVDASLTPDALQQKLVDTLDIVSPSVIDFAELQHQLAAKATANTLFSLVPENARLNWQKVAAAAALSYRFSVISGGPGTGKTTTVAKLLAALIFSSDKPNGPDIKLVAPTGKAANRLTESIGKAVAALPVDKSVREKIPVQASTIHRLLGAIPNRVEFRHHEGNRLHLDILVVDEASMVDLPLMARLLSALPDHARVILLGDRDQLSSVEAGAVLGDICAQADNHYSKERAAFLSALTGFELLTANANQPVADGVCLLRKSYRFHAKSGVGQLAFAINDGDAKRLHNVLAQGYDDIALHDLDGDVYTSAIQLAVDGYRGYLTALSAGESHLAVIQRFTQVRLLCALAEGPFGVAGLNRAIEKALVANRLIAPGEELFYSGRPIMVTQNDHGLGLYNGDIGIVVNQEDGLRVIFEMSDGSLKAFLPSRLPEHQTAYAMTIHKSQGSEFSHTILVLPPTPTPVMTRELVYTGVTRAKDRLDIYATRASLERAVRRKTQRFSGLANALLDH
ncbi:exodeoxyribonuclease V subunit alpha [Enterovibrio norvegicus]|uniref:exodeoxyribonuclease V subunit alpha n=1 Tax=Enterovibrio norvegicus TaxID=188144 RepID=UPI0002E2DF4D|nr:exodeoxyribonuclease V subunit alpha [Enterovibrio norvegicus]OEE62556.1 exodeoxyribonuclease V subunit alpha [Enterovibrio norvegicus]